MQAKKVIVTASVDVLRTGVITFKPELPQEKTDILDNYNFSQVAKGFVKFSDRFYESGKSFEIYNPFYNGFLLGCDLPSEFKRECHGISYWRNIA
jgi:Flavin containing amine oxidoreductase